MASSSMVPASTLDNLQTAFNGESNARARYLAFAAKADEEGYGPVASLFRAAARAEEIHANNHARVIKSLGAQPKATIEIPLVKITHENLEGAVKGECHERDEMYPAFLKQARLEENAAAVDTFHLAREVEAVHAKLYTIALRELDRRRGGNVTYYVCPVCGFTSLTPEDDDCPVCATPTDQFEEIQ